MRSILIALCALIWTTSAYAQSGNLCRTSPPGTVSQACASEAMVSQSRGTLTPVAFSSLAACSSTTAGQTADVTDSTTNVFGATITGGGSFHVLAYCNGTNWSVAGGGSAISLPAGVLSNTLNSITGNYSIATTDCGKTVLWSGSPGVLTLPAVTGFSGTCAVQVCNGNANDASHHAAGLSGFPVPSLGRLWMQQCTVVSIENAAWAVTAFPGKFRPAFVPTLYVDNAGSDSNDGMVSNASANALLNPQTCFTIFQREMDLGTLQPTCSPTGGQTFTGGINCAAAGVITVYNVYGNGGVATIRNTGGNVVAQLSDFCGYIIFDAVNLDCTAAASHPCFSLYVHQQNGFDFSTGGHTTGVTLTGANSSDIGVWCDSMCKGNFNSTLTLAGTMSQGVWLEQGSFGFFSNGITVSTGTTVTANIVKVDAGSQVSYSGALTAGSPVSVGQIFLALGNGSQVCIGTLTTSGTFTNAKQYAVLNNATLFNQSATAIPGPASAGCSTAAGCGGTWANGIVIATSASGC